MKPFTLFVGAIDQLGVCDATLEPKYKPVVDSVNQLRNRLITEPVLRRPFRHLFNSVYNHNSQFRDRAPSDKDVIDFLQNSFPDLHLVHGDFGPEEISRGETWSGRKGAEREKITINLRLVQVWLRAVST